MLTSTHYSHLLQSLVKLYFAHVKFCFIICGPSVFYYSMFRSVSLRVVRSPAAPLSFAGVRSFSTTASLAAPKKKDKSDDKKDAKDTAKPEEEAVVPPKATEGEEEVSVRDMRPKQLMGELDKHIVGQGDAKKAVAIALRNRWRRQQVAEDIREEIAPKNILMVGPTGVGKTEIARRLAKLVDAPFIKVEATKFTEVGFHGRDVETIIDDLYKAALNQTEKVLMKRFEDTAKQRAEDRILQALAGDAGQFRGHLRNGVLDDLEVMIDVQEKKETPKSSATPDGAQIAFDISAMIGMGAKRQRLVKRNMKIKEAMPVVLQEELQKMVETADVQKEALRSCEEEGIVVIDEIDKIVTPASGYKGPQASAEGVQQDLLPLVEGTTVTTKNNIQIKTDKILFICSGAFHSVKVSDMLAELQGRLPIRVHLKPLSKEDFYRIITEPKYNLVNQHVAMLATEGVELEVTDDAKMEIARIAAHVNSTVQNIGARRLITITEKVMEDLSFNAPDKKGEKVVVDGEYVRKAVEGLINKVDLTKYLL